jgi:amino acid adenylation domain-containing protein
MTVKEFVAEVETMHFSLAVEKGRLILKGDRQKLGDERINEIRNNAEIVSYIKENKEELIAYVLKAKRADTGRSQNISSIYRLSALQEGLLFHGLYAKRAGAYLMQLGCELVQLDVGALRASWAEVIRRHTILRSGFHHKVFKMPVQVVHRQIDLPFTVLDYRQMGAAEQAEALAAWKINDRQKDFEFSAAPLMRIVLFRLGEDRYRLLWSWHHILFDGWSTAVLMEELLKTYEQLVSGSEAEPVETDRFEEYIRYLEGQDAAADEAYWRGYLSGVRSGSLLPFVGAAVERNKGIGEYRTELLRLGGEATGQVERYAQHHRITINTVMQGVWSYLLHWYTGNRDVIFGVTVSGRSEGLAGVEKRVGLYINALPLRAAIEEEQPLAEWLGELQEQQIASREHQYTPLGAIGQWLGMAGQDLFDSLMTFENYPVSKVLSAGGKNRRLQISGLEVQEQTNYPLTLMIHHGEELVVQFSYNAGLLDDATMRRIAGHFDRVLRQLTTGKGLRSGELDPLTETERQQLMEGFNDTRVDYPADRTVIDLIEEQVRQSPAAVAVVYEGQELTYGELDRRSNQLGHYLRGLGVREDTLVPICLERGFAMIIGILGILKAGGAYVPIDPEYPQDRIQFILEDIGAPWVVVDRTGRKVLAAIADRELIDPDDGLAIGKKDTGGVPRSLLPEHLAYMIYTSGSTGRPKGVLVEQGSLLNRLRWAQGYFGLEPKDRVLQKTTYCFDVSVWELLWPLLSGSVLVFARPGGHKDSRYIKELIKERGITMVHFVPSMLEVFLQEVEPGDCESLRRLLCSGEALRADQVRLFRERLGEGVELYNLYGPTEAAIDVTCWRAPEGSVEVVPIGRPVWNTRLYILDERGALCPVGVPGELYIGGVQVARGYWKRPELTAEKFVADPYGPGRLYGTGDLCRWQEDGNIAYMGRRDDQVKVRGYRIELGEIESVLGVYPGIRHAVIVVREDGAGSKRLVGYVVTAGGMDREGMEQYLAGKLPEYMVPRQWVELAEVPLTGSGKVDRKALPEPDGSGMPQPDYVAPRRGIEEALVEIWQELLGLERVGINDNFFELGGTSLLIIRLANTLEAQWQITVNITTLFEYPTIRRLANYLEVRETPDPDTGSAGREDLLEDVGRFMNRMDNIENEAYESV